MRVLRLLGPAIIAGGVLTGCGSSHSTEPSRTPGTLPPGAGAVISQRQIQQYMSYALHFYSWVDTSAPVSGTTSCSVHSVSPTCATLRQQVLRRLVEEQVIAAYAQTHHITLSPADVGRIDDEMHRLQAPQSGTRRLFSTERVSPRFMRGVLRNQLLVKRVEAKVVGPSSLAGPSFRMRKYVFSHDASGYRQATDLATGGTTSVVGRPPPIHWVAAYRLSAHVRMLAAVAAKGDFVGPTPHGSTYVVYQVLAHGYHRYGLPARQQIEARSFRAWLEKRMSRAKPLCLLPNSTPEPCAVAYH